MLGTPCWIAPTPPAVGAVCITTRITRGVAEALREIGRRVPDDIALAGYDNWDVFAAAGRPPLTTVDMCLEELGRHAARRLLASIGGEPSLGLEQLPGKLVIRESTGAARRGGPTARASLSGHRAPAFGGRTAAGLTSAPHDGFGPGAEGTGSQRSAWMTSWTARWKVG